MKRETNFWAALVDMLRLFRNDHPVVKLIALAVVVSLVLGICCVASWGIGRSTGHFTEASSLLALKMLMSPRKS